MPKSPQTLDPPPESHRRNGSAILSLVQGLGGKAGRGLATFEDYERMVKNRPPKFSSAQVNYRLAKGEERCGTCIHMFQQIAGERRTTCEILRTSDEQIDAMSVCDFTTANGRDYPLLGDRKNASSKEGKNG